MSLYFYLFYIYYIYQFYVDSDCGEPLLDKAVIKATSSLPDRGPENVKLNGNFQFLFMSIINYLQCVNAKTDH